MNMPNSPEKLNPCIYYAIGDVHGEVERLATLHDTILEHHQLTRPNAAQIIVHLGDYIDRGPDSCGVIERITALEAEAELAEKLQIVSLKGNHEQQMLEALADPEGAAMRVWKRRLIGGKETLKSYEQRWIEGETLIQEHRAWIEGLPSIWRPTGTPYVFVHAGVDPILFPHEDEKVYLWTRSSDFFDTKQWRSADLQEAVIVHGHTATRNDEPEIAGNGRRINIDTGAVYGGPLTCVVLSTDEPGMRFLYA